MVIYYPIPIAPGCNLFSSSLRGSGSSGSGRSTVRLLLSGQQGRYIGYRQRAGEVEALPDDGSGRDFGRKIPFCFLFRGPFEHPVIVILGLWILV